MRPGSVLDVVAAKPHNEEKMVMMERKIDGSLATRRTSKNISSKSVIFLLCFLHQKEARQSGGGGINKKTNKDK